MLAVITSAAIVALFCIYLIDSLKKKKYKAITQKYGGPKGLPLLGVLLNLKNGEEFSYDWPKLIRNINSKSTFVWYGTIPTFYTFNPDFVEKIFLSSDCNVKAGIYYLLRKELGPGLITLGGSTWSHHRRHINPSFNNRVLLSFFPIFNEKSSQFIVELDDLVGKGAFEIHNRIQNFTIKTAFVTFFDVEIRDCDERSKKFMFHAERSWRLFLDRLVTVSGQYDFIYRFTKYHQSYTESKQFLMDFMRDILKDKIEFTKLSQNQKVPTEEDSLDTKKTDNRFIYHGIDIYQKQIFSWDDFYFEALTMLFAGFETSTNTVYSIVIFLAMHPHYQEKLFKELLNLYPDKEFDVKYEDLKHLVYMDMVINEALRVAPTVPVIGRTVTKDMKLADDLVLPKGTTILIDIFNMHRSKDVWGPNAEQFNPDNFLPANLEGKHSCCYTPFAKGARNCIGSRYAAFFLKICLSKILRNYRFTTEFRYENLRYMSNLTIGYEVKPKLEIYRR